MAAFDLEEQEQLDELKTWWKQYGNLVTGLVVAVAVAVVGLQVWRWYQGSRSAQAAAVFATLQKAVGEKQSKVARDAAGELIDKYAGTAYAGMAALTGARLAMDQGDAKTARAQLEWAAKEASDASLRELARVRLAALLLDDKAYDQALAQLDGLGEGPFGARAADMKGEILLAQGKTAEAREAFKTALARMEAKPATQEGGEAHAPGFRDLVQGKLDALGGGS